jgi:signal transduction histidine kinase/tetratricopeptide (TPR) repeat protein
MTDVLRIQLLEEQLAVLERDSNAHVNKKIDLLNDLAWELSDTDSARAQELSQIAHDLATANPAGLYDLGIAYSYRTQGYLNQRNGRYPEGLTQLLQAQTIFERHQHTEGLPDIFDSIAGIYYQMGDFAEALEVMLRQLQAAQKIGDKNRIANAYNNLANIYFNTGEYDKAVETLHKNLQIASETGYTRIKALSYHNLAETYLLSGDYEKALQNGRIALQIDREAGFVLFELYAMNTIGEVYLKLDARPQAIAYLQQALTLSQEAKSDVITVLVLLNLSNAYWVDNQSSTALNHLHDCVELATKIKAGSECYKAHLLFSEIYEALDNPTQALFHYKLYQQWKEQVFNEQADKRREVLQVIHDTETARQEAEITRLHYVELEKAKAEVDAINQDLEQIVAERTAKLLLEIQERTQAEDQIKDYALKLEKINDELQELSYVSSHHLQEPLRKIQIFCTRLQEKSGDKLDESAAHYLQRIQQSAARMQTMILDLQMLARLSNQQLQMTVVNLSDAAAAARRQLEQSIARTNAQIYIAALPQTLADYNLMVLLFRHLFDNALKFHQPQMPPEIMVQSFEGDGQYLEVHVIDNGLGFDEKYLAQIFLLFKRLHIQDEYAGNGIGLTICRKILSLHRGDISAQSQPGQGSRFIIKLPDQLAAN